jgi:glyoxylase-like metal-dependent hydrolase (beta-lactamase superfamily II)
LIKASLYSVLWLCWILLPLASSASDSRSSLRLHNVTANVYAIVGPLTNRTKENLGNNATFGFVVTDDGVVLIDSGGTYRGARAIHQVIQSVTDKPVRLVINTGGQDHRWLGNSYFKKQGARIIASAAAVADQKARVQDQLIMLGTLVGDEILEGTNDVYADELIQDQKTFSFGGTRFEVLRGHAHTPGDMLVWLPQSKVMFTGDMVYVERMLGVIDVSSSANWIHSFEIMAGYRPQHIVPGHGNPTTLERARKDTYDYLVFLRNTVRKYVELGGTEGGVGRLDQSRFSYLQNYALLKGRNIQRVFQELEWE